jgi:hypothetical protein
MKSLEKILIIIVTILIFILFFSIKYEFSVERFSLNLNDLNYLNRFEIMIANEEIIEIFDESDTSLQKKYDEILDSDFDEKDGITLINKYMYNNCLKSYDKNSVKEFGDFISFFKFYQSNDKVIIIKSNIEENLNEYTYNIYYVICRIREIGNFDDFDYTICYDYELCKSSFLVDKITGKTDLKIDKDNLQEINWMNTEVIEFSGKVEF